VRNQESVPSRPDDYFTRAGKLLPILDAHRQQGRCRLDAAEEARFIDWMDLNGQRNDYLRLPLEAPPLSSFDSSVQRMIASDVTKYPMKMEIVPAAEAALRARLKTRFGEAVAAQPLPALINVWYPDLSRILHAPLAAATGGWGQMTPAWDRADDPDRETLHTLCRAVVGAP